MRKKLNITPDTMVLITTLVYVYFLASWSGFLSKANDFLNITDNPTVAALVGGLVGAVCTGVILYVLNTLTEGKKEQQERERVLKAIRTEMVSIYGWYIYLVRNRLMDSTKDGYKHLPPIGQVKPSNNYFVIFDGLSEKLGILDWDVSIKIIEFYTGYKLLFDKLIHHHERVRELNRLIQTKAISEESLALEEEAIVSFVNSIVREDPKLNNTYNSAIAAINKALVEK